MIDVNTTFAGVDERTFREAVKTDCFKREPDETSGWLRSDEVIEHFLQSLQMLASDLHNQLAGYKEEVEGGRREPDDDWKLRTNRLKRAVDARIVEIRYLVKERNRHRSEAKAGTGVDRRSLFTQLRQLRFAIHQHRDTVLGEDYEPTDADLELWAILDGEEVGL